jgi:hypothetical protein
MDKSQRQLIDTYFRKRAIANEEVKYTQHEEYELNYMIKNNYGIDNLVSGDILYIILSKGSIPPMLDKLLNRLNSNDKSEILKKHPELIDRIDTENLDQFDIGHIITKRPELINFFAKDLPRLTSSTIYGILSDQPELHTYFHPSRINSGEAQWLIGKYPDIMIDYYGLANFDQDNIANILTRKPSLHKLFDLDRLDERGLVKVLRYSPELIDILKPYLHKLSVSSISTLLDTRPDMYKYFEDSPNYKIYIDKMNRNNKSIYKK